MKLTEPMRHNDSAHTGRADLLRFLHLHGPSGLGAMAEFAGYERRQRFKKDKSVKIITDSAKTEDVSTSTVEHRFDNTVAKMPFWYVKRKRRLKPEEIISVEPQWAKGDDGFAPGEIGADYDKKPPPVIPLVAWFRLWPFLKKALGRDHFGKTPDIPKILDHIARFEPLRKLPLKSQFGWDARACLILDLDDRLLPVRGDISRVCNGIFNLRGKSGLTVYIIENGPAETFRKKDNRYDPVVNFKLPDPMTPVLILSDMGCLEPSGLLLKQWLRFGRRLKRAGVTPVVLNPAPPKYWDHRLSRYYTILWWDHANRHIRVRKTKSYDTAKRAGAVEQAEAKAMHLLHLLAPAIRVEPELLRAIRMLLPIDESDGAAEIAAWNHASVRRSYTAFTFQKEKLESYRKKFTQERDETLRQQVIDLIEQYHAHLSPAVRWEEKLISGTLENTASPSADAFIKRFFRTIRKQRRQNLTDWFERLTNRQHPNVWKKNDALAACWFLINRFHWQHGRITPPEGLDISRVAWLTGAEKTPQTYRLFQKGDAFQVVHKDVALGTDADDFDTGSRIDEFLARRNYLTVVYDYQPDVKTILLEPEKEVSISIPAEGALTLGTDYDEIVLETVKRPDWATNMGFLLSSLLKALHTECDGSVRGRL